MFDAMDNGSWDQAEQKAYEAYELYEDGRMHLALLQLHEAIELNPSNSAWHFNAGLTLDALERYDDAIDYYEKALTLNCEDPEILNSLAVDYTRTGRYDLALETFETIQQIEPDFEPGYCNRIIAYTEMDQHDKAEQMFYLAQQLNPDCPICFYNIGNSLFTRQKYKKAIWCWGRTALLEPTHPQINYRIAQAHWADGNLQLARLHFLQELRTNPGDIDVILDFGIFLLKKGEHDCAREKFNRILELEPGFGPALFYLGEMAFDRDDCAKAMDFYHQATKTDPKLPGPRYRLARIALMTGDHKKVRKHLRQEYALDIQDPDVLMAMGSMFLAIDELDYATDCFLRIVDEDRENAKAFCCLGVTLAKKHEFDGALQFFQHALSLEKNDLDILTNIALLYYDTGLLTCASKIIDTARSAHPENIEIARLARRIRTAQLKQSIRRRIQRNALCQNLTLAVARYKYKIRRLFRKY